MESSVEINKFRQLRSVSKFLSIFILCSLSIWRTSDYKPRTKKPPSQVIPAFFVLFLDFKTFDREIICLT